MVHNRKKSWTLGFEEEVMESLWKNATTNWHFLRNHMYQDKEEMQVRWNRLEC
jgi:hypothetical protein